MKRRNWGGGALQSSLHMCSLQLCSNVGQAIRKCPTNEGWHWDALILWDSCWSVTFSHIMILFNAVFYVWTIPATKVLAGKHTGGRIIIWVLTVSFHKDDANPNCCSDKQWAALLQIGSAGIDWSVFVNITAEWVEFYSEEWVGFLNHQLETQN